MKKNIGIITYYDAINEGAFLQAYCLGAFLQKEFDMNVRYIKNSFINMSKNQRINLLTSKNPKRLLNDFRRYTSLRMAQRKHLKTSANRTGFDLLVVGSDEMWNVGNAVYSDYNIDGGISGVEKISYAVSMGNYSGGIPNKLSNSINQYSAVSVRDNNAYRLLNETISKDIQIHIDPVFLIDIPNTMPSKNLDKFIMIYGLINDEIEIKSIKKLARKKGLKTISIDIYNEWCDLNLVAKTPFEFIGYFDIANFIVTNMFHGTMISVARSKSFISLLTERRRFKIEYAADILKFEKFCLKNEKDGEKLYKLMDERINCKPDYQMINRIIQKERKRTKEYFGNVIISN